MQPQYNLPLLDNLSFYSRQKFYISRHNSVIPSINGFRAVIITFISGGAFIHSSLYHHYFHSLKFSGPPQLQIQFSCWLPELWSRVPRRALYGASEITSIMAAPTTLSAGQTTGHKPTRSSARILTARPVYGRPPEIR